ncbi:Lrp/AsnC family transcriptional regulator [Candidatus Woesearchaeota archaeon]|nr:Lrp/AsnC family transcriptional regulator [Candidatus Woesearchaeota archaeon]
MKETQRKILQALRQNCRVSVNHLHKETNIPAITLYTNLQRLRNSGTIRKNTVLLDFAKLGYPLHIIFYFDFYDERDVKFLCKDNLNTLLQLDLPHVFLAEAFFKNGVQLDRFLNEFEERIKPKKILFWQVKNDIMRERFLC